MLTPEMNVLTDELKARATELIATLAPQLEGLYPQVKLDDWDEDDREFFLGDPEDTEPPIQMLHPDEYKSYQEQPLGGGYPSEHSLMCWWDLQEALEDKGFTEQAGLLRELLKIQQLADC
jgi:hypothetical protein